MSGVLGMDPRFPSLLTSATVASRSLERTSTVIVDNDNNDNTHDDDEKDLDVLSRSEYLLVIHLYVVI